MINNLEPPTIYVLESVLQMIKREDKDAVWGFALTADQSTLYSTGRSFLSKWSLSNLSLLLSAYIPERVFRIILSPNEKLLFLGASEATGDILVHSSSTLAKLYSFSAHAASIKALTLIPEHCLLVTGATDHKIKVWGLQPGVFGFEGKEQKQLPFEGSYQPQTAIKTLSDHQDWVWALTPSRKSLKKSQTSVGSDGKGQEAGFLYSGSSDKNLFEWSVPDFVLSRKMSLSEWVMSVLLVNDSIYVGGQSRIFVIDQAKWAVVNAVSVHNGSIWELALGGEDSVLATCSNDRRIQIGPLSNLRERKTLHTHTDQVYAMALVGDLLISGGCDRSLVFRNVSDELKTFKKHTEKTAGGEPVNFPSKVSSPDPEKVSTSFEKHEKQKNDCEFKNEEELHEHLPRKLFFGKNEWVFGVLRGGKLVAGNENIDRPFKFQGVERYVVGFTEDGEVISEGGEVFALDYERKIILRKGKIDLF